MAQQELRMVSPELARPLPHRSSHGVFMRLETGVGNRDAISLLGRRSIALLSILIAAQFPSHERVNQTDDAQ